MSAEALSRRTTLFFSLLTLALVWLVVELASAALLSAAGGSIFSPQTARGERAEVLRHATAHANLEAAKAPAVADPQLDESAPEVLHPFLGFVRDPTAEGSRFPLNDLGFFASPAPEGPAEDRLTVGVFGGSVAVGLSRSPQLLQALERAEAASGRKVWVRSFALGGYKQPQQLIALNYALALGEELDVVINLDGFNDIALAPIEFEQVGLFPAYPRRWPRRIVGIPDIDSQRRVGEIAYLEGGRARRVAWCGGPYLGISPTCHLIWKAFDFRTSQRLNALRQAQALDAPTDRSYVSFGPEVEHSRDSLLKNLVGLWERSSEQMHMLSEAKGVRYFHFLQPNQYDPDSKPLSAEEQRSAFHDAQPWATAVPTAYPELSEGGRRLRARGVSFHDMRGVFEGVEETLYIDTCCHFNERGMGRLATAIVDIIDDELQNTPARQDRADVERR
ncbi:MAG: hypothetical protein AAFY88_18095 [Acidobacteriota bacterium]